MADIGYGYGSEWHLLHELGRRREAFTRLVECVTGRTDIKWLDHQEILDNSTGWLTLREHRGLEFMAAGDVVRAEWERLWPQSGNVHSWDAVGRASTAEQTSWVLLEAKAHIGELASSCGAKDDDSQRRIRSVLDSTRRDLGVIGQADWSQGYYQYCNRIALLHFLTTRGVDAHLVFVYFTGDRTDLGRMRRQCPADEAGWADVLFDQDRHAGLPAGAAIRGRIHRMFLPVHRANIAEQIMKPEYSRPSISSSKSAASPVETPAPPSELTRAFDEAMMQIYLVAKNQAGYNATRFIQMLGEHGGVETARRLLPQMSDGFTQLWQRNRLDLTVESLILQTQWHGLFSAAERDIARRRLRECGANV